MQINILLYFLYKFIPKPIVVFVGKNRIIKPIRDIVVRLGPSISRVIEGSVAFRLKDKLIAINFTAPPATLVKAQKKGIEKGIINKVYEYCSNKDEGIIIDVGANYGFLSIIWSLAMPNHEIHAFEVHPEIYKTLISNKQKNNISNLYINLNAISDKEELLNFHFHSKTAILNKIINNDLGSEINAKSIDMLFMKIDKKVLAIKIDTDGNDYNCLLGATNIIDKWKPFIIAELNEDLRILDFLKNKGYLLFDMSGNFIDIELLRGSTSSFANIYAVTSV